MRAKRKRTREDLQSVNSALQKQRHRLLEDIGKLANNCRYYTSILTTLRQLPAINTTPQPPPPPPPPQRPSPSPMEPSPPPPLQLSPPPPPPPSSPPPETAHPVYMRRKKCLRWEADQAEPVGLGVKPGLLQALPGDRVSCREDGQCWTGGLLNLLPWQAELRGPISIRAAAPAAPAAAPAAPAEPLTVPPLLLEGHAGGQSSVPSQPMTSAGPASITSFPEMMSPDIVDVTSAGVHAAGEDPAWNLSDDQDLMAFLQTLGKDDPADSCADTMQQDGQRGLLPFPQVLKSPQLSPETQNPRWGEDQQTSGLLQCPGPLSYLSPPTSALCPSEVNYFT